MATDPILTHSQRTVSDLELREYDFEDPAEVSAMEVCWFDDTGFGGCRTPQSWRLLYADGDQWKPVDATSAYETRIDTVNRLTFRPVRTTGLRIMAQPKQEYSAGIIEWRVE